MKTKTKRLIWTGVIGSAAFLVLVLITYFILVFTFTNSLFTDDLVQGIVDEINETNIVEPHGTDHMHLGTNLPNQNIDPTRETPVDEDML